MTRLSRIAFLLSFISQIIIVNAQSVSTQHNDHDRSGWYPTEKILNTTNVRLGAFGKLFSRPVDDQIYSQPLVIMNVPMAGGNKNVVYVPTVNNSVYAYDADNAETTAPYWQINLTPPNSRPFKNTDMVGACDGFYRDYSNNIGIVGTPVIDTLTRTMYLVSRSFNTTSSTYHQYLHAIDITNGTQRQGSPMEIAAQVSGTGDGSEGGIVKFQALKQNQRASLLLLDGVVYIAWASYCTWPPYHGWLLGYDKTTLEQKIVYCTTPNGKEGGIWLSAGGPAADAAGNIYVAVGNGTPGYNGNISDVINRGESVLKLTPSGTTLSVASWFSPKDVERLVAADLDLGVTGIMLIPNSDRVITGSKDGKLYLMDRNNMGGFSADHDTNLQVIDLGSTAHLRSSFAYYKGSAKEFVFSWSENGLLRAFPYDRTTNKLDPDHQVTSGVQGPIGNNGAFLSVSSNGSDDASAILWASHALGGDANQAIQPGILHAFAANDVSRELWNSSHYETDAPGNYAKFSCPTIVNGKVYLATFSNSLTVFGLTGKVVGLENCTGDNIGQNKTAVSTSNESALFPASNAFDGDTTTRWSSGFTDNESIYVDLGAKMDFCGVRIKWEDAMGKDFMIQASDDAVTWDTLTTIKGNTDHLVELPLEGSGRYLKMQGIKRATEFGYSIWEMRVYGAPAGSCPAPNGLQATNISQQSATLTWNANGLTKFIVSYKTVSAASWQTQTVTTNALTLTTLGCASDYFFKVQGICDAVNSIESNAVSFSTSSCDGGCSPLPTRWNSQDIGDVSIAGSACYNDGTYSIAASGSDIWGNADNFRYTYKTITGDGEILARIVTMDSSDVWNKGGVMIRESLAPGSRHAMVVISSQSGATLQYRNSTNGESAEGHAEPDVRLPYWMKLVKSGKMYSGFISADGITWTPMGGAIDLGFGENVPVYAGIALTSHNTAKLTHANVDSYLFSGLLDIDLQLFKATMSTTNTVDLEWITSMENNIATFTVERSVDNLHYTDIDTVAAKNNGSIELTYTSEDKQPPIGSVYYRLRITDTEGKVSYSAPVTIGSVVTAVADQGVLLPSVYPNPSKDGSIYVKEGLEKIRMITLIDPAGKGVLHTEGSFESITEIPVRMMANGMYVVEVRTEKGVYREKVVIKN